jgi:monofunctional biosynthetic peptidoglycan transglycosylase
MRKMLRLLLKILLWVVVSSAGITLLFRFVPVPFTPLMFIRQWEPRSDGRETPLKHEWISADEMPENLRLAVVCSEDQRFFQHAGFDFDAIQKAYKRNQQAKGKRPVVGASTISQQTAKNVFLWQGRTYVRKGLEAYFTLLIELLWGKDRILLVYLNSIEMGDGIYGAQAAAQAYFHKDARNLTRSESALIAAVLPNPRRWSPANPNAYIRRKQSRILRRMAHWGNRLEGLRNAPEQE